MNYFLDTEFIEDGTILDLISLAIVSEDDRELYVLNSGARLMRADNWVKQHVLQYLPGVSINENKDIVCDNKYCNPLHNWMPMHKIMLAVIKFIGDDQTPVFWVDYGAYDWVAFVRCFGRLIDLPKNFPMYFRDFQMLLDICGRPGIPTGLGLCSELNSTIHIALDDAKDLKKLHTYIAKRFEITVNDHEGTAVHTAVL